MLYDYWTMRNSFYPFNLYDDETTRNSAFRFALYDDGTIRNPVFMFRRLRSGILWSFHPLRRWDYSPVLCLTLYDGRTTRISTFSFHPLRWSIHSESCLFGSPSTMTGQYGTFSFLVTLYDYGTARSLVFFISSSKMMRPCRILFSPSSMMWPRGVLTFRLKCVRCLYHEGFDVFVSLSTIIEHVVLLLQNLDEAWFLFSLFLYPSHSCYFSVLYIALRSDIVSHFTRFSVRI